MRTATSYPTERLPITDKPNSKIPMTPPNSAPACSNSPKAGSDSEKPPFIQPVVLSSTLVKKPRSKDGRKAVSLMGLPQELLDMILGFAFPGGAMPLPNPANTTLTFWSRRREKGYHPAGHQPRVTQKVPSPSSVMISSEPWIPKVDEMLVSKRFFHTAARAFVAACPIHSAYFPRYHRAFLLAAFARNVHADSYHLCEAEGYRNLRVLTLRLDWKLFIPVDFESIKLYMPEIRGNEIAEYIKLKHDGIFGEGEMRGHGGLARLLGSRGVREVQFLWQACSLCAKSHSEHCEANRLRFEGLVRREIMKPITPEIEEAMARHKRYLGGTESSSEVANPLYPGSAVSWNTPNVVPPRNQAVDHHKFMNEAQSGVKRRLKPEDEGPSPKALWKRI
ncbi:hypothetical protein MBLNU230_g6066t1 [Neophaeotheca triangularis]